MNKIKPEQAPQQEIVSTHDWKKTHSFNTACCFCRVGCKYRIKVVKFECKKCGTILLYNRRDAKCKYKFGRNNDNRDHWVTSKIAGEPGFYLYENDVWTTCATVMMVNALK